MATTTRGVLGGAKTMSRRSRWRELRAERIARQKKERAEILARERDAAEEEDEEEEDDEPAAPARSKKNKKGKAMAAPARTARLGYLPTMNSNRWTSLIIWLVGAYLTRAFLVQIGVAEDAATPIGVLLQWLLTRAESPLWRGQGRPAIAIIATLIDGGMNAGGTWVYTRNIGQTDFWAMVQYAAQDPNLVPTVATQIACAIGVGLLTAAAAEYYWNLPSK